MNIAWIGFASLLLLAALYGMHYQKKGFCKDGMSIENTKAIKGMVAILIILHHISIYGYGILPQYLSVFRNIGYLFVGIFFFYSGYGLLKSFQTKPDYLNGFLVKRLTTVLVPFFTMNIIYLVIYSMFYGKNYSIWELIQYIVGIKLINTYAWYPIMILILYIAFYFFFKYFKEKKAVLLITIFALLTIIIRMQFIETQWFLTTASFAIGIWIAYRQKECARYVQKNYWIIVSALILIIYLLFYGWIRPPQGVSRHMSTITINICGTILLYCISMKVKVGNKILLFLGEISYELYIMHQIAMLICRPLGQNYGVLIYAMITILTTVGMAYLTHIGNKKIIKWIKKWDEKTIKSENRIEIERR